MRILLAETTWHAATAAADLLCAGYLVTRVDSAAEVLDFIDGATQSAIVFDADLPDMKATRLLRKLRAKPQLPPLFVLSQSRDWAANKPLWEAGADDVLSGKFSTAELAARLRRAICRAAGYGLPTLTHGGLTLDTDRQQALWHDQPLALTRKEYEILELLALSRDRMITRDQIMAQLYAWEDEPSARIINVYLSRIRSQIAAVGGDDGLVETVWGMGYRLAPPVAAAPARQHAA